MSADDTAAMGVGKLARESNSGFSRSYTYDGLSRPQSTTTTIDGLTYTTAQSYDAAGRVAVITYPTGFAVRQVYQPTGYLKQLQHASSGQVYWTAEEVDAVGRITHESLGNGLETVRVYAPDRGRLRRIITRPIGGAAGVQNLDYQFDPSGNLEYRADLRQGTREDFGYDDLNRLTDVTTVTGSGTTLAKHVNYDGRQRQDQDWRGGDVRL